jgi:hypothetical protein
MVVPKAAHFSLIQKFFHMGMAAARVACPEDGRTGGIKSIGSRKGAGALPYKFGGDKWYSGGLFLAARADLP